MRAQLLASSISAINKRLDAGLAQFAGRRLEEPYPYLILDARYERVREAGVIRSQAVLVAVAVGWDGRRCVLGVKLANRESRSSWRDFLLGLKERGLHGVEFAVADDHAGLRAALREALAEAAYQRCYVHFLRNALDYVPRKVDDDCSRSHPGCQAETPPIDLSEFAEPALPPPARTIAIVVRVRSVLVMDCIGVLPVWSRRSFRLAHETPVAPLRPESR